MLIFYFTPNLQNFRNFINAKEENAANFHKSIQKGLLSLFFTFLQTRFSLQVCFFCPDVVPLTGFLELSLEFLPLPGHRD